MAAAASRDRRVLGAAAVLGLVGLSTLPSAVAPNIVRAVVENGACTYAHLGSAAKTSSRHVG